MSVLSDEHIGNRLHLSDSSPLRLRIQPYADSSPPGAISYGLSSGGYDLRLSRAYKVFTGRRGAQVDPKAMSPLCFDEVEADVCIIPPNSFALGCSMEWLRIPRDVIATCLGKSTYVRCGIIASITPLEPEWEGNVTIEIANTTPCEARVYSGEGIIQVLFHLLTAPCVKSYADKRGRYQGQTGITLAKV